MYKTIFCKAEFLFVACEECPNQFLNVLSNFLVFLIFTILLSRILFLASKKNFYLSQYFVFKLFMDYLHFVFLTQKYDTSLFKTSMEISLFLKAISWFSFNCFLSLVNPENDYYLMTFLKIFSFYLMIGIYILIYICCNRRKMNYRAFFVFFYATYPFFLTFLLENFYFEVIDDQMVLKVDIRIDCSDNLFIMYRILFLTPQIFVILIIFPALYLKKKEGLSFRGFLKTIYAYIFSEVTECNEFFHKGFEEIAKEFFLFLEKIILTTVNTSLLDEEEKVYINLAILLYFQILAMAKFRYSNKLIKKSFLTMKTIFLLDSYFYMILFYFFSETLATCLIIISAIIKCYLFIFCVLLYGRNSESLKKNLVFIRLRRIFGKFFSSQNNKIGKKGFKTKIQKDVLDVQEQLDEKKN